MVLNPTSMKWSETIDFPAPLRALSWLAAVPSENWESLLHEREQAAYERGRRDAETALQAQVKQVKVESATLQNGVLESLRQALPGLIQESESALIAIALEAAGRIVAGMPVDAAMVEAVVKEALRQAQDTAEILIQLNVEDLALLRQQDSNILQGLPDKGPLRFIASGEVSRGGCLVQTRFGVIDARREVKLEQLGESLAS